MTELPPAAPAHPSILTYLQSCPPHLPDGVEGQRKTGITPWFHVTLFSVFTYRPQTPFVTCPAIHYAAFPHSISHDSSPERAGGPLQRSTPSHTSHLHQHIQCLLSRSGNKQQGVGSFKFMTMGSNSSVARELGAVRLLTGLLSPALFPTYRHPAVQPLSGYGPSTSLSEQ